MKPKLFRVCSVKPACPVTTWAGSCRPQKESCSAWRTLYSTCSSSARTRVYWRGRSSPWSWPVPLHSWRTGIGRYRFEGVWYGGLSVLLGYSSLQSWNQNAWSSPKFLVLMPSPFIWSCIAFLFVSLYFRTWREPLSCTKNHSNAK